MDEKTVIAGRIADRGDEAVSPASPMPPQTALPETTQATDSNATIIAPARPPVKANLAKAGGDAGKPAGTPPAAALPPASKAKSASGFPLIALLGLALVFVGLGSALTTVYVLSPRSTTLAVVGDQDLSNDLVPVETAQNEAADEALIRAATQPRIFDLSGDPVVIRQLGSAPRQLLKLASDAQRAAKNSLGINSDLFRLRDVLDAPTPGAIAGVFGTQEDLAMSQATPAAGDAGKSGDAPAANQNSSVIQVSDVSGAGRTTDFAETVKANTPISVLLKSLGMDAAGAQSAEDAFGSLYGRLIAQKGDKVAVRAITGDTPEGPMQPVQLSLYSADQLVGSIALSDTDSFTKSEDPWYQRDIFETQLLPVSTAPEDQPRLLDAIYAAALRDRVPSPVVGETMMLLSRSVDLEQKVQPGDTLTLVYSPIARDLGSGLGRVVFVSIGRTSGNLDCYVMQPQPDQPYACMSLTGESSVNAVGMVTPVNGVIVAKFGPQGSSADAAQQDMNFGVDWTAPAGTPVVAALAGDVTAIGPEANFGTVVRLSHADGKTTMYGYLQRAATGLAAGAKVEAGQVIGYVGTPPTSREPRLHFELRNGGVPVDPVPEMQASVGGGGAVDQFVQRIITIESGNRCDAHNPLSSAVGLGQFLETTWMTTIRLHRPDLLIGRSRSEVLALRTNCDLARAMTQAFTRDNAAVIRQSGHPVTPGNLYLAHFLGVGGAIKALASQASLQIVDVFGAAHVRANPFEQGKTVGYLIAWAARKMGAAPSSRPATQQTASATTSSATTTKATTNTAAANTAAAAGKDQPVQATGSASNTAATDASPLQKYDSNPAFTKLKAAVIAFLQ